MAANETSHRNQLSYQEVLAALPAYAQGALDPQQQAAVDAYLNRHVDLFRQLDVVESNHGQAGARSATPPAWQMHNHGVQMPNPIAFAQVMEGYASTQQLPDNPLLMRNAPQRITDQRTGQRFIVPRRSHQRQKSTTGKYPQDEQQLGWANPLLWGLLALAAVAAIILIGLHQLRLQQRLTAAESALAARQPPSTATNQTYLVDLLGATPPLTAWLTNASQPISPIGTLLIDGQQGLMVIQNLPALPSSQRYQLWLIDQQAAVSPVISFAVADARQPQWLPFVLPIAANAVAQIGISAEPADGSTKPSGDFLLTTTLR